ncbi:hypothetical protein Bca4012_039255 [Brassica carinata]|uniref:Uncharacterized protein n=1 Tax=Brassica carinata TaxID=52824 RepID=A0A8X7W743_BRACI|nr:hypothetical protein Bca52824_007469 [Brassica carinata]
MFLRVWKTRMLNKKFERGKKNGRLFSKPHDQNMFDLSKSIWEDDEIKSAKKDEPLLKIGEQQEFFPVVEALIRLGMDRLTTVYRDKRGFLSTSVK